MPLERFTLEWVYENSWKSTRLIILQIGMLLGPTIGGFLLELSQGRKYVPFVVVSVFILLDGLGRLFIIGNQYAINAFWH
jgi:hypothetical protein